MLKVSTLENVDIERIILKFFNNRFQFKIFKRFYLKLLNLVDFLHHKNVEIFN